MLDTLELGQLYYVLIQARSDLGDRPFFLVFCFWFFAWAAAQLATVLQSVGQLSFRWDVLLKIKLN